MDEMAIARPLGAALDPHQIAKSIPLSRDAKLRAEQRFVELRCTGIMRATSIGGKGAARIEEERGFWRSAFLAHDQDGAAGLLAY